MKDKVALRVQKAPPSVQEADVLKGFNKLSKADQRRFLELHEGNRLYGKIFRIWKGVVLNCLRMPTAKLLLISGLV